MKQEIMTQTTFSMNKILSEARKEKSEERRNSENDESENQNSQQDESVLSEASKVNVTLEESDLWKKFEALTNEMIVTKNGRYDFIALICLMI